MVMVIRKYKDKSDKIKEKDNDKNVE